MTESITMSQREIDRLGVIQAVRERRLKQSDAVRQLGVSVRQVKRLCRRLREDGAAGLVSRHRGRRPNNAIPGAVRDAVLALLRERYRDFGPTLACEKLAECHDFACSVETVRQWMIADGLWQPNRINNMATANAFVPGFMADFNRRFAKAPQNEADAHRPVLHDVPELALILCLQHARKLSKNLTFRFQNREYQLTGQGQGYRLRGAEITVCEGFDGTITPLHNGKALAWQLRAEGGRPIALDDEKSVHQTVEMAKQKQHLAPKWKPSPDHPWHKMTRVAAQQTSMRGPQDNQGTFLLWVDTVLDEAATRRSSPVK